jgi:hypothetical protein
MCIPTYRIKEFKKIYEVFFDECKLYDLKERKDKLKKIIRLKYSWLTNDEYNHLYNIIKTQEINNYFKTKKSIISNKYKTKILEIYALFDTNKDNEINMKEFSSIMSELNLYSIEEIEKLFICADTNGDKALSINEFVDFLTFNEHILDKLDKIIKYKFNIKRLSDKRTIIFKDFPGSPLKKPWRPSLANMNSFEYINNNSIIKNYPKKH